MEEAEKFVGEAGKFVGEAGKFVGKASNLPFPQKHTHTHWITG